MSVERTRHLVEAALSDQGWAVYRLVLGRGPALVASIDGSDPILVAVARASEPRGDGTAYPRLDRAEGAHALASVTSDGRVTFHDPIRGDGDERLALIVGPLRMLRITARGAERRSAVENGST